ncbi:uncharacterized protein LOC141643376 [Silene latifolia]|uniref:uncharacterized protein LOC141643376 n=1 Tax=Silene latifolia TaxID=37657 RepID=UPI003D787850
MSGSFRRRHSKWDDKDSEALTENFHDSAQARRPIEPVSPSRGSRRHNSRSKDRATTWDREENIARSSGPSELRQHDSRSPRNGWAQSYSRSRSRSRSPSHYLRRDPAGNDRSRNRSGVSGKVCRDFVTGRCRRGSGCHFLHQDAQPYDSRQPLDHSPPDDWESRHRGVGGSRYSPVDTKDYAPRTEKSMHICSDFLKGKCRRGASCRYEHQDLVDDSFKEDLIDDSHRDRDHFQKNRDSYSHRNHDRQPVDDVHRDRDRDRDIAPRSRDTYSHRNHDREPADVYEKRPIEDVHRDRDNSNRSRDTFSNRDHENRPADDVHRDRDNALRNRDIYTHRNHDSEPSDMFDKRHVDNSHRDRETSQRSRDTYQNHDRGSAGRFEKGPVGDAYRDRDYDHKVKNVYRNHDSEPQKRGGTLCKFFASGNCKNGNRCRFIHEVQERLSPQRRSQDDKRGPDHKIESNQVWDGPSWSEVATMTNIAPVRGWGEEKNEVKEVTAAKSEDNSRSHDMVNVKETWVMPVSNDGFQDEKPQFQWESGDSLSTSRVVEKVSGDMEISPMDTKQHPLCSSNSHAPPLSNISFASVQPNPVSEGFYEKPYPIGFQEQTVHIELSTMQNPSHENEKPVVYHGEGINVIPIPNMNGPPQQGFFQVDQNVSIQPNSGLIPFSGHVMSPTLNVPPRQDLFQIDQTINAQPSSGSSLPAPQGLAQFASETSDGNRMQQLSHNPPSFLNSVATDGPHLVNATTSASLNIVSDEQLVQLSNLSASLAQLLENRQQLPQLSSATILPDMPNHLVSETSKQQYDPTSDSVEPNVQKSSYEVEQITDNMVQDKEGDGMMQQEPLITSEDDEKVKKIAEGNSKEPENKPSEDVPVDDADDGNKGKDSKAIRPFKFALAEFVKELLKPSWKDGQINKDAYKTIVKKVVDKIIETQGLQIPHAKEKIDLYLSCSKPKIEKLVQAYVGKFQKNQI